MKKKLKKPSIKTVNHRDGGMSFYAEGGEFDFVRNQSPNPTTNFEKRMYHTPYIDNQDGSISSHKMMSWSDDKGYYAAPTIVQLSDGQLHEFTNPDEAINYAYNTGEYKTFSSPEESEAYANNGYKFGTPMEMFAPNEGLRTFAKGGPTPSLQSAYKLKLQREREEAVRQAELKEKFSKKPDMKMPTLASTNPSYVKTPVTKEIPDSIYSQTDLDYFTKNNIPKNQWYNDKQKRQAASLKARQDAKDAEVVKKRYDINKQAAEDIAKGDFTTARAENLSNAFRLFPDDANSFFDDYLNPLQMVGNWSSNLGQHFASDRVQPKNWEEAKDDMLDFAGSVASPLVGGYFTGLGTKTTGQFINNAINPLAGIGQKQINRLKNKFTTPPISNVKLPIDNVKLPANSSKWGSASRDYLKKEYDIEIRKKGLSDLISEEDFINQGLNQRATPIADAYNLDYRTINPTRESIINQSKGYASWPQFRNEQTIDNIYQGFKNGSAMDPIIVMNMPDGGKRIVAGNTRLNVAEQLGITPHAITINPKSNFKSEIDWSKWNPETPNQDDLMREYNYIEETTKKNGTWMKNANGTPYDGTPEQFIQENSSWFKRAYPEGYDVSYKGVNDGNNSPDFSLPPRGSENNPELIGDRSIFTGNRDLANGYAFILDGSTPPILNPLSSPDAQGVFELLHKKGKKLTYNADGDNWLELNLSKTSSKENIAANLNRINSQLEMYKKMDDFPKEIVEGLEARKAQLEKYIEDFDELDITNIEELKKLRSALGDRTSTDDIARYLKNTDLNKIQLKNINDGGLGDVTIVNNRPGNYLKSRVGNIGYFDLNNPNVYKNIFLPGLGAAMYNYYNPTAPPQQEFGGIQLSNRMFEEGGEYELTQEEIDNLKSQGYDLELL